MSLLLVIALQVSAVSAAKATDYERDLAGVLNQDFHFLSHYDCGRADRKSAMAKVGRRLILLRQQYVALGGTLPADRDIVTETVHYRCYGGGGEETSRLWNAALQNAELHLAKAKRLLIKWQGIKR